MQEETKLFEDDRHCFVCGEENPVGLNLDWVLSEDESHLTTRFVPDKQWQGWKDVVHGGIVTTVLDEIMVNHGIYCGEPLVSVELNVRFKQPAEIGEELVFRGHAEPRRGRLFEGEARCQQNDETIAEATAKLMRIEAEVPDVWDQT